MVKTVHKLVVYRQALKLRSCHISHIWRCIPIYHVIIRDDINKLNIYSVYTNSIQMNCYTTVYVHTPSLYTACCYSNKEYLGGEKTWTATL